MVFPVATVLQVATLTPFTPCEVLEEAWDGRSGAVGLCEGLADSG